MEKRKLGKTGLEVSLLGFGGFHLLEIPLNKTVNLLNYYIDNGGNYIETAADYGDGESEKKIGQVMKTRRNEVILATKTGKRDAIGARKDIERSMKNLNTDYIDIIFMHAVGTLSDLDQILGSGGAYEAATDFIKEGKIGHIAISMHGQPDVLIEAIKRNKFDVVMATLNFFDKFNFPKLEDELIPTAIENNIGLMCMKPLADGFLWRSAEKAFRYSFSLPVSIVVTGMNSIGMVQNNIKLANNYLEMTSSEKEELYKSSPELGNYICRQCGNCTICPENIDIPTIFKYEGYFDRQMADGDPRNPADFALRERLRFWFQNSDLAKEKYKALKVKSDSCTECGNCMTKCPHNIDIIKKLKIAGYKLGQSNSLF